MNIFTTAFFVLFSLFSSFIEKPQRLQSAVITKSHEQAPKDIKTVSSSKERYKDKKKMLDPVVKLISFKPQSIGTPALGSTATGFGFAKDQLQSKTFILTNHHFCVGQINENETIMVQTSLKSKSGQKITATGKVIKSSKNYDLCVISVNEDLPIVNFAPIEYQVKPFEKVMVVGAPAGVFPVMLDTYFSEHIEREELKALKMGLAGEDFLLISARLESGHSGSPIFNENREVIGIVFAARMNTYGGFGVSLMDIAVFLSSK